MGKIRNTARLLRSIAQEIPPFVGSLRYNLKRPSEMSDTVKNAFRRGKIDPIIRTLTDRVAHTDLTTRMGGDNKLYRALRKPTLIPKTKRIANVAAWHATDVLERAKVIPKRQATRIKNTIARVNQDDIDTARWIAIYDDIPMGYNAPMREKIALSLLEPRTARTIQLKKPSGNGFKDALDAQYRRRRGVALVGLGLGAGAGITSAVYAKNKNVKKRYPPYQMQQSAPVNTRQATVRSGKYFTKNAIDDIKRNHSRAWSSAPNSEMKSTFGLRSVSRLPSKQILSYYPWLARKNKTTTSSFNRQLNTSTPISANSYNGSVSDLERLINRR